MLAPGNGPLGSVETISARKRRDLLAHKLTEEAPEI